MRQLLVFGGTALYYNLFIVFHDANVALLSDFVQRTVLKEGSLTLSLAIDYVLHDLINNARFHNRERVILLQVRQHCLTKDVELE